MAELDPEQIKREQERLDALSKQSTSAKELASTYEKIAKAKGRINDEDRQTISLARQLAEYSSNIEKSIEKRISGTASIKDLSKTLKGLELDLAKNQNKYQETLDKINRDKSKALTKAFDAHRRERKLKDELDELDQKTYEKQLRAQQAIQQGNVNRAKELAREVKENQRIAKSKEKEIEQTIKEKEEQKNLVKSLREAAQTHTKLINSQKEEIDLLKEAIKLQQKEEALGVIKKALRIDEIKDMLTISGLLKMIFSWANQFNKTSVEISKNLGYSRSNANDVADSFMKIANTSTNVNVTFKSLAEAANQIQTATGGVLDYSRMNADQARDILETQVMLTKQFGLTGDEAAGIYKFSVLTGKSSERVNDEMVGAFVSTRNMVKGSANFKATMAEVAKVSGQLAANFKNNPAEITKAVVQAQALGTTLEQTKNQGAQLLEFSTSIENELKAELLTGQQMNLERARAAALMGDQVTVMKELANQGMTLEKFQSMNVVAQDAFAKALGLSADQLSEQLKKQKIAKEQGKSLAQITKEEALDAQKRQAAQDRFNAVIEKLQDLIGSIGRLLVPVLDFFVFITDNALALAGVLGLIALAKLPAIAKGVSGIAGGFKSAFVNATKLFSASGRASLFGGGGGAPAPTPPTGGGGVGGGLGGFMGKMPSATSMLKGAGAILILSGAIYVAAKAFQQFASVKWEDIGKGAVAIAGLSVIAIVLGKAKGAILEGAAAMAVLGIGLIPLALALRIATPAIEAFGNVLSKVFKGVATVIKASAEGISTMFTSLGSVDVSKLLSIGPALTMIGIGLASLGTGNVINAIGTFLGGDPIKKIEKLAAAGNGLQAAASGMKGMAEALTQVAIALNSIDTAKLEALNTFSTKMAIKSVAKGVTDFITAPVKAISGAIEGGKGKETNNAEIVAAINQVRSEIVKLNNKETSIYLDGKKIGTTLTLGSYKSS